MATNVIRYNPGLFLDPFLERALNNPSLRKVSRFFRDQFDTGLRHQWNVLRNNPPSGPMDLDRVIKCIDAKDGDQSPINRFRSLIGFFERMGVKLGTLFGAQPFLPCYPQDIQKLQNALDQIQQDQALETVWHMMRNQYSSFPELRNAADMRTWLIDPHNKEVIKSVKLLVLKDLKLCCVPRELKLFTHLEHLSLSGNQIAHIEPNAFEGLANLKLLSLAKNAIKTIDSNAFAGLENLEKLFLFQNKIDQINAGAFLPLKNLKLLNLGHNQLDRIQIGLFPELPLLESLLLDYNKIQYIQPQAFTHLKGLERLDLSNNELWFLAPKALSGLENLSMLKLFRNEFQYSPLDVLNSLPKLKKFQILENPFPIAQIDLNPS